MKKTVARLLSVSLVLACLAIWALDGQIAWNAHEIATAAIALVLVGFAVYL